MRPSTSLYHAATLLALITSAAAAVISSSRPIVQNTQAPVNISLPNRLADDDVRFSLRGHHGEEAVNIISLLMNTVHALANLAHQPFRKRIPGFHVDILPWYADLDISIQPAAPARDIEVQVAVTALYYVVYNMIDTKTFKNAAFDILWDGSVVGQIQINKAAGPSRIVSAGFNTPQISSEQPIPLLNDTTATHRTTNHSLREQGLSLFYSYFPQAGIMSFQEVFITLMAALRCLSHFPSAQVVEPFETGARGYVAWMKFYGAEPPRTEPPFLTYAILIETVRQIPFHMMESKLFAELQVLIGYDDAPVGQAVLQNGSPELSGIGICGGSSGCNVSSS